MLTTYTILIPTSEQPPDSVSPDVETKSTPGYGTGTTLPSGKSAGVGPPTKGFGESIAKPPRPERDWVDVTDKLIDWFVKLVGCAVAVYGAAGLYRNKNQAGVKQ